jgi:hypothetical protein
MKKLIILVILLLFCLVGCTDQPLSIFNSITKSDLAKLDYSKLTDLNMQKDDLNLIIDGNTINLSSQVYLDKNRYYICLNDIVKNLSGTIKRDNDILILNLLNQTVEIDTTNNNYKNADILTDLKEPLKTEDDFYYINFSDFTNMLDIYTRWDASSNTIFCKTFGNSIDNIESYKPKIETLGFLRMEDIDLTTQSYDKDFLEKIRIIGNYLAKRNIPYHIAWIPRYLCPAQNIDIDPIKANNFVNAEMVYTLDFFTTHNGIIGLHGYTHQTGKQESAIGFEFGKACPSDSLFKEKIEKAIETAKYLDIPIAFFETPHYEITPEQNKIAEKYFKILYYPFKDSGASHIDLTKPQLSPYNKSSYYISTPLDYIQSDNINRALNRIRHCDTKKMGSVFYHPRLDFDFIKLTSDNNIPSYQYDDNSTLKTLISILEEKGFKMSKVTDIK